MFRATCLSSVLLVLSLGCADPAAAPPVKAAADTPVAAQQQDAEAKETETKSGFGDKMSKLVDQAKANAPTFKDVKKMISDAGDATGQTADDTMGWVNETYKSLSDRGMTSAKSAGEWVADDWRSMNAWEYKVVTVDSKQIASNPAILEEKLNESGKQRWDCFHVSDGIGGTMFYMKRQKKSYLKNVPLRDMLKLIPLLDNNDGP